LQNSRKYAIIELRQWKAFEVKMKMKKIKYFFYIFDRLAGEFPQIHLHPAGRLFFIPILYGG